MQCCCFFLSYCISCSGCYICILCALPHSRKWSCSFWAFIIYMTWPIFRGLEGASSISTSSHLFCFYQMSLVKWKSWTWGSFVSWCWEPGSVTVDLFYLWQLEIVLKLQLKMDFFCIIRHYDEFTRLTLLKLSAKFTLKVGLVKTGSCQFFLDYQP